MGLAAAERCIALRVELKKDAISLSRAYWMAGAHHLALHQCDVAAERFTTAFRYANGAPAGTGPIGCRVESNLDEILNVGYLGIAREASGQGDRIALGYNFF